MDCMLNIYWHYLFNPLNPSVDVILEPVNSVVVQIDWFLNEGNTGV